MRTVLYANREVSDYLRENFVLLWSSERPVPRVTIDFGDGRVIERTITGNAVHYVLDGQGRPLDAIPGLYGPGAFVRALHQGWETFTALEGVSSELRAEVLRERHSRLAQGNYRRLEKYWGNYRSQRAEAARPVSRLATAAEAGRIATSKFGIELRVVEKVSAPETDFEWRGIAHLRARDASLDARSLLLMARELPGTRADADAIARVRAAAAPFAAERAVVRARGKNAGGEGLLLARLSQPEQELAQMVGTFEESLAIDSVRNEHEFRAQIHEWFVAGEVTTLDSLNERVYREIFLTPRSDPWLGLGAQENYTGIRGGGRS